MSAHAAVAEPIDREAQFAGEPAYLDGYVPSSFDSPHTSLTRVLTWLGAASILASLAFWGTIVFGLATKVYDQNDAADTFLVVGVVGALVFLFGGFFLVHLGRRDYKKYVKRTGRIH
ncbi:hypothetical protein [Corynebacterium bovis]|uniref:hypothetical protein n=1 Tax=Corynebacterium bovis TaxID=36808 RepID=UPI00265719D7|nr:hypothetical protein [Corynebacterium bovis]MDN8579236.1 hypothetical protein [Corynebacterium bovis]